MRLTCLDAGKWDGELSNKIVPGCLVIVLHHETNQGQFRGVDQEIQSFVPDWVKTCVQGRELDSHLLPAVFSLILLFLHTKLSPLLLMWLVSSLAWSCWTPYISTLTSGSTMEPSFWLTFGSCCPLITCETRDSQCFTLDPQSDLMVSSQLPSIFDYYMICCFNKQHINLPFTSLLFLMAIFSTWSHCLRASSYLPLLLVLTANPVQTEWKNHFCQSKLISKLIYYFGIYHNRNRLAFHSSSLSVLLKAFLEEAACVREWPSVLQCDAVVNLYGQAQWFVVLALLWFIWTELGVSVPHEVGLENVAAAAVWRKQSVVQVHFQTGRLEIQSHFGREEEEGKVRIINEARRLSHSTTQQHMLGLSLVHCHLVPWWTNQDRGASSALTSCLYLSSGLTVNRNIESTTLRNTAEYEFESWWMCLHIFGLDLVVLEY